MNLIDRIDQLGRDAGAELRQRTEGATVPVLPARRRNPAFIRLAVAGAAVVVIAFGAASIRAEHHAEPATQTSASDPEPLPSLVPAELPPDATVTRGAEVGRDTASRFWVFATGGIARRGVGELLVTIHDAPGVGGALAAPPVSDAENGERIANGRRFVLASVPVDNGQTWRSLAWAVDDDAFASAQTTTLTADELIEHASGLVITDREVRSTTIGQLQLAQSSISAEVSERREIEVLTTPDRFLRVGTYRITTEPIPEWMPGREIKIDGSRAWLSHQPFQATGRVWERAATLSWPISPRVRVTVYARGYGDDEVLAIARSLKDIGEPAWQALPVR